ncbi:hypothetical protein EDD22DRAFT_1051037 [Suillus occidentalis]|nr:hypothetical protein EDD22DRAFT_1051037 [Suillus occidentalis]
MATGIERVPVSNWYTALKEQNFATWICPRRIHRGSVFFGGYPLGFHNLEGTLTASCQFKTPALTCLVRMTVTAISVKANRRSNQPWVQRNDIVKYNCHAELCVDESRWRLVPKFRAARGEKEGGSRALRLMSQFMSFACQAGMSRELRLRFRGQVEVWWCSQNKSKTNTWKFGIIKWSLFDVTLPVTETQRIRCGESQAQDNLQLGVVLMIEMNEYDISFSPRSREHILCEGDLEMVALMSCRYLAWEASGD